MIVILFDNDVNDYFDVFSNFLNISIIKNGEFLFFFNGEIILSEFVHALIL